MVIRGIESNLIKRAQNGFRPKNKHRQSSFRTTKEKSTFNKANKLQEKATQESRKLIKQYNEKLEIYMKSQINNIVIEQQGKFLKVGKKIFDLIGRHKGDQTNKGLNESVKKLVAIEKERALSIKRAPVLDKRLKAPKLQKPKQKEQPIVQTSDEKPTSLKPITVGARVRIPGHTKTGVVML